MCDYLAFDHKVVNPSLGFLAPYETHSNNIKGFQFHLKSSMRKENCVKQINLDSWLVEYSFKRRYLMKCNGEEFENIFISILKILLK